MITGFTEWIVWMMGLFSVTLTMYRLCVSKSLSFNFNKWVNYENSRFKRTFSKQLIIWKEWIYNWDQGLGKDLTFLTAIHQWISQTSDPIWNIVYWSIVWNSYYDTYSSFPSFHDLPPYKYGWNMEYCIYILFHFLNIINNKINSCGYNVISTMSILTDTIKY